MFLNLLKNFFKNETNYATGKNFTEFCYKRWQKGLTNFCKHGKILTLIFAPYKIFYIVSGALVKKIKENLAN